MPVSAAKPCNSRTCTGLVRNGECNKCGAIRRGKDRAYDEGRGTAHQRGYGANWQKVRRMQLACEPLCADCMAGVSINGGGGVITPATEVHHIKARRDGGTDSFDNLMSLCKTHHSQRTAKGE